WSGVGGELAGSWRGVGGELAGQAPQPLGSSALRVAANSALHSLNTDHPVNAEFVREPANSGAPRLLGQRHLDSAACSQFMEDAGEAVSVPAAQGNSQVLAEGGRVVGMPVRGE